MVLEIHGEIAVRGGLATLSSEYSPAERGPGKLRLLAEDQTTFESAKVTLKLDPWSPDGYELIEWAGSDVLLLCGAQAVVALKATTLVVGSSVGLEYEEAETLDRPWACSVHERSLLVLATERRVWCIDESARMTWIWSCRTSARERWICGAPEVTGETVRVPIRTLRGELVVELTSDGLETGV